MEDRFEIIYSQTLTVDRERSREHDYFEVLRDKKSGVEYLYVKSIRDRMGDYSISITPLLDADGMPSVKY